MVDRPDAATGEPSAGNGDDGPASDEADEEADLCDFCRLPIPEDPVTVEREGDTYCYCCEGCRSAVDDSGKVFTQYHGHRRTPTGVDPIDDSLPQGIPRNSFVMLTDLAGTRTEAVQAELVWRALQRGEPAVYVSFLEPPMSVIQEFVTLDWNVLPYLESGQFHIVDCFTYRLENRERMYDRLNDWNAHLSSVADRSSSTVRDPTELGELRSRIDSALEDRGMEDEGVVVIDSLTEFGSLVQPVRSYAFMKDLRAEVCKSRFVPVFAGATVSGEDNEFPHDLGYMVDGIVEMSLNEDLVEGSLLKQIRVRKMSGVLNLPKWVLYEYTAGDGIVTIEIHEGPPDSEEDDEDETSAAVPGVDPAGATGDGDEGDGPESGSPERESPPHRSSDPAESTPADAEDSDAEGS